MGRFRSQLSAQIWLELVTANFFKSENIKSLVDFGYGMGNYVKHSKHSKKLILMLSDLIERHFFTSIMKQNKAMPFGTNSRFMLILSTDIIFFVWLVGLVKIICSV